MIYLAMLMFIFSCGSKETIYPAPKPTEVKAYTFAELDAVCSKCHNETTANPKIPHDEVAFKASAKVKSEIESGDMPPNPAGFDKAKALAFFAVKKPKPVDDGGYQ
jgi:hypothetical protein